MYQYFVDPYNAQIVTFVAKACVLTALGEIASLISYASTPKALIFSFFSSFENIFAFALDKRLRPGVYKHRARSTRTVSLKSWLTVSIAVICCTAALLSDLLLFQFVASRQQFRVKITRKEFTFHDTTNMLGTVKQVLPSVLVSNSTADTVFGKSTYLSDDGMYYTHRKIHQEARLGVEVDTSSLNITEDITRNGDNYTYMTVYGEFNLTQNQTGYPRCLLINVVDPPTAMWGLNPAAISCMVYNNESTASSIPNFRTNIDGSEGNTLATMYQTNEGANYMFLTLDHRSYDGLSSETDTYSVNRVEQNLDSLITSGYKLEVSNLNDVPIYASSNDSAFSLLKESLETNDTWACNSTATYCVGTFLFSKIVTTYEFGRTNHPIYTRKYFLCSLEFTADYFSTDGGSAVFSTMSYDIRHALVPGKQVIERYVRRTMGYIGDTPLSLAILTDRTDHEVILSTLQSPNYPLIAIPSQFQNAFPAFVVIASCFLFVVVSQVVQLLYRRNYHRKLPFDVNLETYHKALENLNGLNAWNLSAKFELYGNVQMYNTESAGSTNSFYIGLAPDHSVDTGSLMGSRINSGVGLLSQGSAHEMKNVRASIVSGISNNSYIGAYLGASTTRGDGDGAGRPLIPRGGQETQNERASVVSGISNDNYNGANLEPSQSIASATTYGDGDGRPLIPRDQV